MNSREQVHQLSLLLSAMAIAEGEHKGLPALDAVTPLALDGARDFGFSAGPDCMTFNQDGETVRLELEPLEDTPPTKQQLRRLLRQGAEQVITDSENYKKALANLAAYVASINWSHKPNSPDWLRGLLAKILAAESLCSDVKTPGTMNMRAPEISSAWPYFDDDGCSTLHLMRGDGKELAVFEIDYPASSADDVASVLNEALGLYK